MVKLARGFSPEACEFYRFFNARRDLRWAFFGALLDPLHQPCAEFSFDVDLRVRSRGRYSDQTEWERFCRGAATLR